MERRTLTYEPASDRDISGFSGPSRGMLYEFLSYMFMKNPREDVIQHLGSDEQIAKLEGIGAAIQACGDMDELRVSLGELLEQIRSLRLIGQAGATRLREDYVRLLRGISRNYGPPPPYESVYRADMMMSNYASEVRAVYREAGLLIQGTEPPDHIGFELAFMAFLCDKEEEHRGGGDSQMADRYALLQKHFLHDHVLTWVPQFCRSILEYDSALYKAVASLTISWLDIEERRANDRKSDSP